MGRDSIPAVILGGSDRRAARLPAAGRGKHPLAGYKGVDIRFQGRPLVETLIQRLQGSGAFSPLFIAGPATVYERLGAPATLIDTDGSFGQNIQIAMETVRLRHPRSPVAFITCDVVPGPDSLRNLIADYYQHAPCDFWFPVIRAPENSSQLGASAWKPAYRVLLEEGQPAVRVLPGHLVITDPEALRLSFVYRLFQLAYRTRNRPIAYRRSVMIRGVLAELLYQDLLHLLSLRLPNLTWTVLRVGISGARGLQAGTLTLERLEDKVRRLFVKSRHRRRYPDRRVRLPVVDDLSLARDIDTEEEAQEISGEHVIPTSPSD